MIGVAFCIHETFGAANNIERLAVARVASHLARTHGLNVESATFERLVKEPDATFALPGTAAKFITAALGPALSASVGDAAIEGLVRSVGVRVAVERYEQDPGTSKVLRALAELNVPRAALSLRWPGIDQIKAEAAGFDGEIVFADDVVAKAESLAPFVRLAATLRLPADQIFFVGTDPRMELHPASLAGMRTVRLDRARVPYPADLRQPNFTIETMDELLPILSGPYTQGLLALRNMMRTALDFRDGHFVPTNADVLPKMLSSEDGGL